MSRATIPLSATTLDDVVTPSAATEIPTGFDIAGAQVAVANANINGASLRVFLEGSNDPGPTPTNWNEVKNADATILAAGVPGVVMLNEANNQVVAIGQFRWVRINGEFSVAIPAGAGTIAGRLVTPGTVASGQPVLP